MSCCFLVSIVQKLLRRNSSITDSVCFCNVRTLRSPHRAVPKSWNRIWQKSLLVSVLHRKGPQRQRFCCLFLHSFLAAESRIHEQGEPNKPRWMNRTFHRGMDYSVTNYRGLIYVWGWRCWMVTFLELSFARVCHLLWVLYRVVSIQSLGVGI